MDLNNRKSGKKHFLKKASSRLIGIVSKTLFKLKWLLLPLARKNNLCKYKDSRYFDDF